METIQLQTNPICPKCKTNHPMKVVGFDKENQLVYYSTTCRVKPLKIPVQEVQSISDELESFYFNSLGWISYVSTHGNYAFEITTDLKENAHALDMAYQGSFEVYHTPVVEETDEEIED